MAVLTATALTGITTRIADASMAAGSIIQVVQTTKEDSSSTTSTSWADIPDMELAITPSATSSKILVQGMINWCPYGSSHGGVKLVNKIASGSYSDTWIGDADGSRIRSTFWSYGNTAWGMPMTINYLHSPNTTSAVTYKWQWHASAGGSTFYINRTYNDTAYQGCTVSNVVLSEVAG